MVMQKNIQQKNIAKARQTCNTKNVRFNRSRKVAEARGSRVAAAVCICVFVRTGSARLLPTSTVLSLPHTTWS